MPLISAGRPPRDFQLRLAKTLHVRRINDFEANQRCALYAMIT